MTDESDFDDDVNDPLFREAEDRTFSYLRHRRGLTVRDTRTKRTTHDFEVDAGGNTYRLDVKADRHADRSGNFPFEERHIHDEGVIRPGWGMAENLDWVVIAAVPSWRAAIFSVSDLREVVRGAVAAGQTNGWVRFARKNRRGTRRWVTEGWAIPLEDLWHFSVLQDMFVLPEPEDKG